MQVIHRHLEFPSLWWFWFFFLNFVSWKNKQITQKTRLIEKLGQYCCNLIIIYFIYILPVFFLFCFLSFFRVVFLFWGFVSNKTKWTQTRTANLFRVWILGRPSWKAARRVIFTCFEDDWTNQNFLCGVVSWRGFSGDSNWKIQQACKEWRFGFGKSFTFLTVPKSLVSSEPHTRPSHAAGWCLPAAI